jgi:hypothetical protein
MRRKGMMTSKKRTGDDPGLAGGSPKANQGSTKALAEMGIDELVGLRGGNRTSEFMNGRRSLAYELHDQGLLSSQKLANEVLFLLPDGFVTFYEALFHQSLMTGDSSVMHGRSGGLGKAPGAQGIVTGSEVSNQAKGSGKRWKNPAYTIGNEQTFEVKVWIDKELARIVRDGVSMLKRVRDKADIERQTALNGTNGISGTDGPGIGGPIRCPGLRAEWVDRGDGSVRPKCGLFLKANWRFCPTCGYRLVGTRIEQDG